MGGVCGGEDYTSKTWWSCGKINAPGGPSSGLKGSILFLEIVIFVFLGNGRGGAQCPLWRVNEPKAMGARSARRARAAKTR